MPSKKRDSSRSTSAAKRMVAFRAAEQKEVRRGDDRARHATVRAAETPDQGQARRENDRTRRFMSRAGHWTLIEREAFQYDPTKNYDSHPQLCIGRVTEVFVHIVMHSSGLGRRQVCVAPMVR